MIPASKNKNERILRERARRLAQPLEQRLDTESIEVLEFGLAGERYAIEAVHVDDVQPLRDLTPLPCTPAFLRGCPVSELAGAGAPQQLAQTIAIN